MIDFDTYIPILQKDKNRAYKVLHEDLKHIIFSIIYNYTQNEEEMKDISQDVWVKIYEKINKYEGGNFIAWVNTICNRTCIDKYRRAKNNKQHYNTFDINKYEFLDSSNLFETKYSDKNLLITEILNCISTLNETEQDLILLKAKGLKFKEIALLTKTNRFTICNRHKIVIMQIVKELEKKGIVKSKQISATKNSYKTQNNYKTYPCI